MLIFEDFEVWGCFGPMFILFIIIILYYRTKKLLKTWKKLQLESISTVTFLGFLKVIYNIWTNK